MELILTKIEAKNTRVRRHGKDSFQKFGNKFVKILASTHSDNKGKGNYPENWKLGQTTPGFKDGHKSSFDCYTPVILLCLTSLTSKVLKKIKCDTFYSKVGHTLHERQCGFLRKRSAILQLVGLPE